MSAPQPGDQVPIPPEFAQKLEMLKQSMAANFMMLVHTAPPGLQHMPLAAACEAAAGIAHQFFGAPANQPEGAPPVPPLVDELKRCMDQFVAEMTLWAPGRSEQWRALVGAGARRLMPAPPPGEVQPTAPGGRIQLVGGKFSEGSKR